MAMELSQDAQRWLARAPEIVNLILVALIALAAARLFWLVWPEPPAQVVAPSDSDATSRAASANNLDIDAIASAHLFGEYIAEKDKPDENKQIEAPETHLNLVLTGIVSDQRGERSRALIKNPQGKQDSYKAGQSIVSGVKLQAIYTNRVILDRNGRYETLTLESVKKARSMTGIKRMRSEPDQAERTVSGQLADQIGDVRQKILADPSSAQRYIRLRPARQDGNLVGYRIYPGADKALFKKAGLKSGELVTAINGKPLDNPAASLKMLGNLARADSATVTLENEGQSRTVRIDFK
ncbi:type II secretion system protein GspC [Salinisphaera sp. SPP-AMP-43]|uniref:type II secretion system protein GspC n=1 Tax=Salinisphaera sp. SPP-AMP-43 TaxID=3121288 RepID=UPI003C6E46C7